MDRHDPDARPRGRRPEARTPRTRPDSAQAQEARKAAEIARSTGLPAADALRVARGQADANDLLRRMALEAEVENLVRRHGLLRALAMQVALGHADLQQLLRRRRAEAHLEAHRDTTILQPGGEFGLGLTGGRTVRARVESVDRYEVVLRDLDAHQPLVVHKLELKFGGVHETLRRVRRAMSWDAARRGQHVVISPRPQDRYGCSDRRLAELQDSHTAMRATLVEGEVLTGEITCVARYEFTLRTRQGDVVIFRHALADLRPA